MSEIIQAQLKSFAQEFNETPLDFTVEADIQARIAEHLRKEYQHNENLKTSFVGESFEGFSADYKQPYVQHLSTKSSESEPLSRVHVELSPREEDEMEPGYGMNQIDIVVLEDELTHPLLWKDGTKRFHPDDFDAVVETKYVKNKNMVTNSLTQTEMDDASKIEIKEAIDKSQNDYQKDIKNLNELAGSMDAYLVIVSNYDYLYQGDIKDASDSKERRYSQLGNAMVDWLTTTGESIEILYVHPTGYNWLSGE